MNRTGKRRLLKLADLLDADADNKKGLKFDLRIALDPDDMNRYKSDFEPEVSCGTVGCAMGLAALSGAFKRAGLSYQFEQVAAAEGRVRNILNLTWGGYSELYIHAAAWLFDISEDEAHFLFSPGYYADRRGFDTEIKGARGERRVARRIRKLVAGEITTEDTRS